MELRVDLKVEPKIEKCYKGYINAIEICVERSSEHAGVWVTMWKNQHHHFQISKTEQNPIRHTNLMAYGTKNESGTRAEYVEQCKEYGCDPYPHGQGMLDSGPITFSW